MSEYVSCSNCRAPVNDRDDGLCLGCRKLGNEASKLADTINNHLEHNGVKLRFTTDQVRTALLANRKQGGK